MRSIAIALGLTVSSLGPLAADNAASTMEVSSELKGSHASMERQNKVARENEFSFMQTSRDVRTLIAEGRLVTVTGNADYKLARVSHPAARPILKTFVERLGAAYHQSCGSPLVVTSLTRPLNEQPRNASDLSVHPAGMAVDLRIPARAGCRIWLENTLLSLEMKGVLDVTRERVPAHYHIAVFPDAYGAYVAPLIAEETRVAEIQAQADADAAALSAAAAARTSAVVAAPAEQASFSPGPGALGTVVWSLIVLTGVIALMLVVHGPAPVEVKSKK